MLYLRLTVTGLALKLFRGEPAISGFDWNFSPIHTSSPPFENDNYEIEDDADLLCALENGGVDNWEWYSESLGHYPEWEDHVNEFYETDNYLDYEDFGIELERREKEERAERLAKKKAEEEAKPKSEIAQLKYDHLILAEKIAELNGANKNYLIV